MNPATLLTRHRRAFARLIHLKTNLRHEYSARRQADPVRTEARALLVEWLRLAGREWIDPKHPFWKIAKSFLNDCAWNRQPIFNDAEMLEIVKAAQTEGGKRAVCQFLARFEGLINTRQKEPRRSGAKLKGITENESYT